jgi:hypothetical protein
LERDMNLGDLCICGHTLEVHFGHECSIVAGSRPWIRRDCQCKQFVVCDLGVPVFQALKASYQEMVGLKAYLETCNTDVIVDNLPSLIESLGRKCTLVADLLREADKQ